jgi:crossover junction endodeoxyribonuclease RuvC
VRHVVGLDLSLTSSGIAIITETHRGLKIATSTVTSKGKRAASVVDRHARLTEIGAGVLHHAGQVELAVIEGPFSGPNGSAIDRHALWWFVVGGLIRREVPVAVVAPTSLKLAIAGKGTADKAALSGALARLWPDLVVGSADEADAAALAHLGAVWMGWPVTTLERHKQVRAEWPILPDPTAMEVA